jgi:hypothetical protein
VNYQNRTKCSVYSNPYNTRNCSQRDSPRYPACRGEHPIFNKKYKLTLKHILEKPKFSPTLPLAIAKEKLVRERRVKEKAIGERREEQGETDENMSDAWGERSRMTGVER